MFQQLKPTRPDGEGSVDKLLTVEEVALIIGTSVRYPRRLIAERRIRFVRVGGRKVRIPESALAEFIAAGTVEPLTKRRAWREEAA